MGVLTMEIEKVNKTIAENQKEVDKLTKQLEKAKKRLENQKQYESQLKFAIENDLKAYFNEQFGTKGLKQGTIYLKLKSTRDEAIKKLAKSELEGNYLDNNYERILKRVAIIYENDEESKNNIVLSEQNEEQKKQLEEQKKAEKFQLIVTTIFKILKWTCIIFIGIIYLIFKFCSELANEQGKRK